MISKSLKIVNLLYRHTDIKIILFLALLIRIIVFASYQPWEDNIVTTKVLTGDVIEYQNFALNILAGEFSGDSRILPGLPIYLATIYYFFGVSPWVVMIFNILFNVLAIYFFYRAILLFSLKKIALITAIWMALDIQAIGFSLTLLSDIPTIFLLVVVFYSTARYIIFEELKYLLLGGVSLGIAVIFRPIGQYLILIILIVFLVKYFNDRIKFFKTASIFTTVYLLVLLPLIYYNYSQYQSIGLGTLGGHNLLNYNAKSILLVQKKMSLVDSDRYIAERLSNIGGDTTKNPFNFEKLQLKVAIEIIEENKLDYLINHFNGCVNFYTALSTVNLSKIFGLDKHNDKSFYWGPSNFSRIEFYLQRDGKGVLVLAIILIIWLTILYISASLGILKLFSVKDYYLLYIILSIILYYTLITGVVAVARYRLPVHPFLMLISAYGITWVYEMIKSKVERIQSKE